MHSESPKMIIIAKKDAMGDEHPDFSGPGFASARKMLLLAAAGPEEPGTIIEDEDADPVGEPEEPDSPDELAEMTPDHHAEIMEIVGELRKASETHAGQADRLEEICRRMSGDSGESGYGEERELA